MQSLNHDPEPAIPYDDTPAFRRVNKSDTSDRQHDSRLTGFLRWAGVILILFSATGFMLQGYAQVGAELRYWIGLLLTLALAAGGILCARLLHETIGARIFFGLATLFIIVQSSQVGAMIYAWIQPDSSVNPTFEWLRFSGVSSVVILLDLVVTAGTLFLVGYAGFTILAKSQTKSLLAPFLLGNALIWLPTRHEVAISFMLVSLFIYLRRTELRLRGNYAMQTWEGRAARALIFVPLIVLAGRESLHTDSGIAWASLWGLLAFTLLWDLEHYINRWWLKAGGELLGVLLATLSWSTFYLTLLPSSFIPFPHSVSSFGISLGLFWLALSFKIHHGKPLRALAAFMTMAIILVEGTGTTSWVLMGMIWTATGIHCREKMTLLPGMIGILLGGAGYLKSLAGFYAQAPWISSAVLGFTVIVLASWVEKRNQRLMTRAIRIFRDVRSW